MHRDSTLKWLLKCVKNSILLEANILWGWLLTTINIHVIPGLKIEGDLGDIVSLSCATSL